MGLRDYMRALDAGEADLALANFSAELRFSMWRASARDTGGIDEFRRYLEQRDPTPDRVHEVWRHLAGDESELVWGRVTESGRTLAWFVAAAQLDSRGLVSRYAVTVDESLALDGPPPATLP